MYKLEPLQKRLSQAKNLREIAKRAGINEKTIQRIKTGENSPSLRTADAVMTAIDSIETERKKHG